MQRSTTNKTVEEVWEAAPAVLASGVSASMRLHPYLGRPFYLARGEGAFVYDLGGKRYLDFNESNGATLLGHGHPAVSAAIEEGLAAGIIAAAETLPNEELANQLCEIIPSVERVRFASTGSEVTMVAVRLARHATGRAKLLKFVGHFHGLSEPFLVRAADPSRPQAELVPSSAGVPAHYTDDVIICPWNDAEAFEAAVRRHGPEIAAVICEPVFYNAGCIPPSPGFLELLRERTSEAGIVLIFDEVLSGFRMALGGAQAYYGVTPDLTTLAKAVANGMPLSVLGGRADLMEQLAPSGPVAHSGTYSGHLLSVLAALATLEELRQPGVYEGLAVRSDMFYRQLGEIFDRHGLPVVVQGLGARFGLYFGRTEPVSTYTDLLEHDHELNRRFVLGCLERNVYFHAYHLEGPPGHSGFSLAHGEEELATALTVIDEVAGEIAHSRKDR